MDNKPIFQVAPDPPKETLTRGQSGCILKVAPDVFTAYLMARRRSLLEELGELEDLLGMPRSVLPSRERRRIERTQAK
jgi:hypothetical protein